QVTADENNPAVTVLVGTPRTLVIAVENHMDTLEHKPFGVVLERQDSLAAQNIGPFSRHQILDPGKELVGIQRRLTPERHALHVFVVIVLETVAMMMVMGAMIAMAMVMMMIVVMMFAFQKIRLDVEDAIEVKGIAPQDLLDVDLGPLGAMQAGIWV